VKLPRRKIVERKVLDGSVTVFVRRPSWDEAQELKAVAGSPGEDTKLRDMLIGRIERIEGLEMEDVGPITTGKQAFDVLDVDTLQDFLRAVSGAAQPSESELGESSPQPSGAASTGPGTAAPVDAAE
jgi:hypothetical protein